MQVFKFGGASVKDANAIENVAAILKQQATEPTVVVVSAMGKITNALEELANASFKKQSNKNELLEKVKHFHFEILDQLFPNKNDVVYNDIENVFVELQWLVEDEDVVDYNFYYDQIVSQGEILSTKIISHFLNSTGIANSWLDVRGVLQTDNNYGEGKINYDLSQTLFTTQVKPLFLKNNFIVTQGFIGGTSENYSTTLGREGSDYTAALLAYFGDASKVTIWKDVPGVLNADPKYFKNTKKIEELSYHDAIELTYFGASVIHPKTIKPLQNKGIPLYVKSFLNPNTEGTLIKASSERSNIASYIFKTNQILISIQPKDFSFIAEDNLSFIFDTFSKCGVKTNMMQNSAISFSVCSDYEELKINKLIAALQKDFKVLYNTNVQLMTIRNPNPEIIESLSQNQTIILEQRSRTTHQMVLKAEEI